MNLIEKFCPWCATVQPARVRRTDTGCCEWECSGCHRRFTVRDGHSGEVLAFYPPDIDGAFDNDLQPLFP